MHVAQWGKIPSSYDNAQALSVTQRTWAITFFVAFLYDLPTSIPYSIAILGSAVVLFN